MVLYTRLLCGLCLGVLCGLLPLEGIIGFAAYASFSTLIIYVMCNTIISVDIASYGGNSALLMEGMMPAGAVFVLTWIVVYTWLWSEVEPFYE